MPVAHKHANRSFLAFYPETAVCTPPADWAADGTIFEHLSVDVANVKPVLIDDPTLETRPKWQGKRAKIKGARGVDWSFRAKMHGLGAETAEGDQADETYLATLLAWCFGGMVRTYTRLVDSSANAYTLTVANGDEAGFVVGACVAVEDVSAAAGTAFYKKPILRQIGAISGQDITLTEALPFTPAAGDKIHATITIYVDDTVLEDAVRGNALHTMNLLHKRTQGDTNTLYQLEGTVASLAIGGLGKGQLPELTFSCLSGNFKHSGVDSLTEPSFGTPVGFPQLAGGPDLWCSIVDASGTTTSSLDVREVAFEPGITRTREETTTTVSDPFEGMSSYSVTHGDAKFSLTLSGYSPTWYQMINDGTEKRVSFSQPGPGTGAGKGWGIIMPRAQVVSNSLNAGTVLNNAVELTALKHELAATEIGTSPFVIALF